MQYDNIVIRPTNMSGATGAEHSCPPASVQVVLKSVPGCAYARFPNSGEVGLWTPQPRFTRRDRLYYACLAKRFWKALLLF